MVLGQTCVPKETMSALQREFGRLFFRHSMWIDLVTRKGTRVSDSLEISLNYIDMIPCHVASAPVSLSVIKYLAGGAPLWVAHRAAKLSPPIYYLSIATLQDGIWVPENMKFGDTLRYVTEAGAPIWELTSPEGPKTDADG